MRNRIQIVEVWNGEKRVRRYTHNFGSPSTVREADQKTVALETVKEKFGRCFPDCEFRLLNSNQ